MGTAAGSRNGRKPASIKTLWAIAKSPELGLSDEDLYTVVYRETGKESMRKLTQGEINNLARILQNMKDGAGGSSRRKRTDEGGDPRTINQRRKIYNLTEELGWNNDNQRIHGFVKRMTGVDRLEWLTPSQCGKVIEGMKAILAREKESEGGM